MPGRKPRMRSSHVDRPWSCHSDSAVFGSAPPGTATTSASGTASFFSFVTIPSTTPALESTVTSIKTVPPRTCKPVSATSFVPAITVPQSNQPSPWHRPRLALHKFQLERSSIRSYRRLSRVPCPEKPWRRLQKRDTVRAFAFFIVSVQINKQKGRVRLRDGACQPHFPANGGAGHQC